MKFNEFTYKRPNIDSYIEEFNEVLNIIGTNVSYEVEKEAFLKYFALFDEFSSDATLVSIRNSINTKDEFYEKETEFFNNESPKLNEYSNLFIKQLLKSKNIKLFKNEYGSLLFDQYELEEKTFKPEIIPLLQKENLLTTKYSKLLSEAEILFEGEIYNLSEMTPFTQSTKREIRKTAEEAVANFFLQNETELDGIYDSLVQTRHEMALILGYENYIQLGYDLLGRTDYGASEVKSYREQIYREVVPYVNELTIKKAKRLNIENPKSYDLTLSFLSGNPTPKGSRTWQVNNAKKMYHEMSNETDEFFKFMINQDLMHLDSMKGKSGGGYCTFIPRENTPFIFANFNGTAHDVDVLTHEAGHAFQVYQSRNLLPAYRWPTMEAAEIHSMSMEFLAWPWIELFFKKDTEKYKYNHLAGAVSFLPYGVLVDEFQHYVYENPKITPKARKAMWRKLEEKYLPFKKYDNDFLNRGGFWFRQGHIFSSPFYYIDYTLAQVVAFQYWTLSQKDYQKALDSYLSLCKLGGSLSFVSLIESVNLDNPFKEGTIKKVLRPIKEYLDNIDDTKL